MDLIKQHILYLLNSFANETRNSLDKIISEIQNDSQIEFTEIICYIESIINLCFLATNSGLSSLHIHIENEFDDSQKLLIGEYLSIKLFKYYHANDNQINSPKFPLIELKGIIESKLKVLENKCPEGAKLTTNAKTKVKQPNEILKKWLKDKNDIRQLLDFYKSLNESSSLNPKSIFNVQKNFCNSLSQIFEFRPYCTMINGKNKSYNLLNAINTLNEIDFGNNEIIDELDSVILFDCERKRVMLNFSYEEINKWNTDYYTRFTKYLIVTFGKENSSINNSRNKLELIRERFKIPTNSSYTITKSEIDFLLNRKESTPLNIEFVGFESSSFWETFVLETSIRELYELRSIKLMNIYSICYNDKIKNYIINVDILVKLTT